MKPRNFGNVFIAWHILKIVVFAFVPETISRINSYWKHYSEFGNKFGFKPFYKLEKNKNEEAYLDYKQCLENPWIKFDENHNKGDKIKSQINDVFEKFLTFYSIYSFV